LIEPRLPFTDRTAAGNDDSRFTKQFESSYKNCMDGGEIPMNGSKTSMDGNGHTDICRRLDGFINPESGCAR